MFLVFLLFVVIVSITFSFTEGFEPSENKKRSDQLIEKYQMINDVFKDYADMTDHFNV
jgi:hypothetical protein